MRRVVITGFGAVTPLGLDAESSWQSAIAGRTGVAPITLFDASNIPVSVAAEIKGFDPNAMLNRRTARRTDRFEQAALVASRQALEHSGLEITDENSERIGVVIATGVGGLTTMVEQVTALVEDGPRRINPFTIPRVMTNGATGAVSIEEGIRGPSFCVTSACASASDGIGTAAMMIRAGMVDAVVAGASECGITEFGIGSFVQMRATSHRSEGTPSPFSSNRDGLVVGEGAAVFILESLEHAKARGATIHAELAGYGASADAYHITAPPEDGSGSANAIRMAMRDARLNPEDVDYINAHGTGTELNDPTETKAVKLALGEEAYNIPMSSTKSMTGHMIGATGALEALFCVQAIRDGIVPPTINLTDPDPACDLDYVPNEAREMTVDIAMSNAFGFGGHNAVLIVKRFND